MTDPAPASVSSPPPRRHRWGRAAMVLWFCALLAVPPLLLAAGLRPISIEQRLPAEAPGFSIGRLLDTDWYQEIAAWFTDRLPLRDRAIEAHALADLTLFAESPSPRVLVGSDGWLFLRDDFAAPCYPARDIRAAVRELSVLDRALRLAGKRLLFIVAPDKSGVYPGLLGGLAARAGCALANRGEFRSLLSGAGLPGYLDAWAVLEAQAAGPRPVYHRLDTHWNDWGAGAVAGAAVERLAPGLWDPGYLVLAGVESRVGDLARLMGLSLREDAEIWQVRRHEEPSLRSEPVSRGIELVTSTMEGSPTIGLSGLLIHDSMGNALAPHLRPYFARLTTVRSVAMGGSFGTDQPWFPEVLRQAGVLMVVKVERAALAAPWGSLASDVVGALADRLPHRNLLEPRLADADLGTRWAGNSGEIVTTGSGEARVPLSLPAAEPGTDRYLVVDLRPRGRIEVRLSWSDPVDGRPRELVDVVRAGAGTASFDLSAVGAATDVEVHLGADRGRRVSAIALVEIPPASGAS